MRRKTTGDRATVAARVPQCPRAWRPTRASPVRGRIQGGQVEEGEDVGARGQATAARGRWTRRIRHGRDAERAQWHAIVVLTTGKDV